MSGSLTRAAPAKLNLGLHVLRKRPDGYHDLETVFVPLRWADRLDGTPADALSLTCSDPALPTDDRNLVVRAARALAAWAGVEPRAPRAGQAHALRCRARERLIGRCRGAPAAR